MSASDTKNPLPADGTPVDGTPYSDTVDALVEFMKPGIRSAWKALMAKTNNQAGVICITHESGGNWSGGFITMEACVKMHGQDFMEPVEADFNDGFIPILVYYPMPGDTAYVYQRFMTPTDEESENIMG
jgi:hypothetical protein